VKNETKNQRDFEQLDLRVHPINWRRREAENSFPCVKSKRELAVLLFLLSHRKLCGEMDIARAASLRSDERLKMHNDFWLTNTVLAVKGY
jgi:hypothetical protein